MCPTARQSGNAQLAAGNSGRVCARLGDAPCLISVWVVGRPNIARRGAVSRIKRCTRPSVSVRFRAPTRPDQRPTSDAWVCWPWRWESVSPALQDLPSRRRTRTRVPVLVPRMVRAARPPIARRRARRPPVQRNRHRRPIPSRPIRTNRGPRPRTPPSPTPATHLRLPGRTRRQREPTPTRMRMQTRSMRPIRDSPGRAPFRRRGRARTGRLPRQPRTSARTPAHPTRPANRLMLVGQPMITGPAMRLTVKLRRAQLNSPTRPRSSNELITRRCRRPQRALTAIRTISLSSPGRSAVSCPRTRHPGRAPPPMPR